MLMEIRSLLTPELDKYNTVTFLFTYSANTVASSLHYEHPRLIYILWKPFGHSSRMFNVKIETGN
jgi:hypothetical protein